MSTLSYLGFSGESDMERPVTWPAWLAAGMAFKPVDGLTITADVQYTGWKTIDVFETTYKDKFWSWLLPFNGYTQIPMNWKNRVQLRIGAEYQFDPNWAVRAGYYNDPSPSPDQAMDILLPMYDSTGLTAGLSRTVGGIHIDFGLEMLFGQERVINGGTISSLPPTTRPMPGQYKMMTLIPTLSVSHRF